MKIRSSSHLVAAVSFLLLTLALAGGDGVAAPDAKAAAAPPADKAAAAAAAAAPAAGKVPGYDVAWKDMTPDQKGEHMKANVLPKMKSLFQAFDADGFKKFDCTNCHGKDPKARKFKMPNPGILKLPGTPEGFMALLKKQPKYEHWAKFMGEEIKPQMAQLLGMTSFDPQKPEAGGFGCGGCHVIKK